MTESIGGCSRVSIKKEIWNGSWSQCNALAGPMNQRNTGNISKVKNKRKPIFLPELPEESSLANTFFFLFFFFFCLLSFVFLGLGPWHMKVPRVGVELELQTLAYTTATAAPDLSCLCNLHHSSQQCWILNPLSEARDRTCVLLDPSQAHFCWTTMGTPLLTL